MSNGFVAVGLAIVAGVAVALVASQLLEDQSMFVREPIAQGLGFVAAWLAIWPWMKRQRGFLAPRGGVAGLVQRTGVTGYLTWFVIGMAAITSVRIYFRTG